MRNEGAKRRKERRLIVITGWLLASLIYTGLSCVGIGAHPAQAAALAAPGAKQAVHTGKPARHARSKTAQRRKPARGSGSRPRSSGKAAPHREKPNYSPVPDSADQAGVGTARKPAPIIVTILAGDVDGTAARIAADISSVLDSADIRVLPVLGKGAVENLRDIAASPYLDLALVPSDALDEAKNRGLGDLAGRVTYIAPLYKEEVQILARGDITTIRQLDGRKVGIGIAGSAISDRASSIFGRLGIKPDMINLDQARALSLLQRGALDAIVFADGKPIPALAALPPQNGLHFVAIPFESPLQDFYYPTRLEPQDYPNLLKPGSEVDTIAFGTILAAFNAPEGSPRYRKLAQFTQAFFGEFNHFLEPGQHPKWQEVNFAADAPGWQRFKPAQDWLDQSEHKTAAAKGDDARQASSSER